MTTEPKAKFYQWPDGSAAYAYRDPEELELFRALGLGHPLVNGVESAAEWILENAEK